MKLELALAFLILALALVFSYFSAGAPNFFAAASPQNMLPSREPGIKTTLETVPMQKIPLYAGGSSGFSTYLQNAKVKGSTCLDFDAERYVGGQTIGTSLPKGRLEALSGYFARVPADCEIILSGDSAASFAGMRLSRGWNHIGAPEAAVKAAEALFGCGIESFMLFDSKQHQYVDADTFYPGSAYWVKVASDCEISG